MAGDWIKMEATTPDKPEVFRMAMDLGITPEHVLGCLLRIWVWADQQTINGNAVCVTGVTVDRIACHTNFSQAMRKVGWLSGDDGSLFFPNFDRHNGETAKTRAQSAKRQSHLRKRQSKSNANTVTSVTPLPLHSNDGDVTREEKRRVLVTAPDKPANKRGSVVAQDFSPNETSIRLADELGVDWESELPKFIDHHTHRGTVGKDWNAGFRTWLNNSVKFGGAKKVPVAANGVLRSSAIC